MTLDAEAVLRALAYTPWRSVPHFNADGDLDGYQVIDSEETPLAAFLVADRLNVQQVATAQAISGLIAAAWWLYLAARDTLEAHARHNMDAVHLNRALLGLNRSLGMVVDASAPLVREAWSKISVGRCTDKV